MAVAWACSHNCSLTPSLGTFICPRCGHKRKRKKKRMNPRSWMGSSKSRRALFPGRLEPRRYLYYWSYWEPSSYLIQPENDAIGNANGVWSTVCSVRGDLSLQCGSWWENHQSLWCWPVRSSWIQKDAITCYPGFSAFILSWVHLLPPLPSSPGHSHHYLPSLLIQFFMFLAWDFLTSFV